MIGCGVLKAPWLLDGGQVCDEGSGRSLHEAVVFARVREWWPGKGEVGIWVALGGWG